MLNAEKTKGVIYCDLLKATWLNFKNSEEILFHSLKNVEDLSLNEVIQILHNDLKDVEKIHNDIGDILREHDQEIIEINEILLEKKAPEEIVSSHQFNIKFKWMKKLLEMEITKLKQLNGDFEDKHTALQHENHEIHSEFRSYISRMKPLSEEKERLNEELEKFRTYYETIQEKLASAEDESLFMKSTVNSQNEEIVQLKDKIAQMEREIYTYNATIAESNLQLNIVFNDLELEKNKNAKLLENGNSFESLTEMSSNNNSHDSYIPKKSDDDCLNCSKYLKKMNRLIHNLEIINNKYSQKREQHRQQLFEARSTYQIKTQELVVQNLSQNETIDRLSESLRITQIRLKKAVHEKTQLSSKMLPLEDELANISNHNTLYQEKIESLENHIKRLTANTFDNQLFVK